MARDKEKTLKSRILSALPYLVFLVGVAIALYPAISRQYYRMEANQEVRSYQEEVSQMDQAEIEERLRLARAYNAAIDPSLLADPYSEDEIEEGLAEYARMLEVREKIGFVEIPILNQTIPIYAGTSEEVLKKGAGHLEGTSLPIGGESTHTVVTAHRGLPEAELFSRLNDMEIGDAFYIHVLGDILAYQVDQILVVEPTDFDPILVSQGKDYATLLTCTPYMINSHRLLVRGTRIDYTPAANEIVLESQSHPSYTGSSS